MQFIGQELLWTIAMLLPFAVATVLAASTQSRDTPKFSMFQWTNDTMLEERTEEHKLRKGTECTLLAEKDKCFIVCNPYKGACPKKHGETDDCMCTDELLFEESCKTVDDCHRKINEVLKDEKSDGHESNEKSNEHESDEKSDEEEFICKDNRCHIQFEAADGNTMLVSKVFEKTVGDAFCNEEVNSHACPNGTVGYCLPASEPFDEMKEQYYCLMTGEHKGFITLTEANEAYIPTPIRMDIVTKALEEHKDCFTACQNHNRHPGYLVLATDIEQPVCNCAAPPKHNAFSEVKSVKVPCKPDDKKDCKVACGKFPAKCVHGEGASYDHCECIHPEMHEAKESH